MAQASGLFTKVFITLTQKWSDTYTFRRLVDLGLPHAAKVTAADNLRAAQRFLADRGNDRLFLDKAKFLELSGGAQVIGAAMTREQLAAFRASVDAASLVFMHSALDGAAYDLCQVTTLVASSDWEPILAEQKVQLSDVKSVGYEAIFKKKLVHYLTAFERESLLKKVDRLFQLCRPPSGFAPILGYRFDRDMLQALDRTRHDIIHGNIAAGLPGDIEASVEFLLNTGLFLLALVNHRYDVKLDPSYLVKASPGATPSH